MKPSWIKVVFWGCAGTPPGGAITLGKEDGSIVPVALEGTTDVEGEGATTMVGATVREVALSVPVGLMLCGAVLVGIRVAGVSVTMTGEVVEPAAVRSVAVVTVDPEPVAAILDSETVPEEVTTSVAVAVADSVPAIAPEVAEVVAVALPDAVAEG